MFLSHFLDVIILLYSQLNNVTQPVQCRIRTLKSLPPKSQQSRSQQFRKIHIFSNENTSIMTWLNHQIKTIGLLYI